mmetsp:Transcript_10487/g.15876  ORF Transcript_10487/g.15876 Transcript_10487/m.15876 type:complete len:421 (-) Transcript_10487:173-1435(-)
MQYLIRSHNLLKTFTSLNNRVSWGKSTQTKVSLSSRSKSSSGNSDNLCTLQNFTEHIPTRLSFWKLDKYIRGIVSSKHLKSNGEHGVLEHSGVFKVVINQFGNLLLSLRIETGESSPLDDIGGTVEGGGHDTVEILTDGCSITEFQIGGYDGPSKSDTGESSILREGVTLNGNFLGTFNFKDGFGNIGITNEGGIGGIKDQDGSTLLANLHQFCQLLLGGSGSSRVIGGAEVYHIGTGKRCIIGEEVILGVTWHVDNVIVLGCLLVDQSRLSHHDGGIDVDGVGRILYGRGDLGSKHLLHTHDIALGTITDEHFIGGDEVIVQYRSDLLTKGCHTLFGTVAGVSLLGSELGGAFDESAEDMRGDGHGGISNSEGDDAVSHLGVSLEVGGTTTADLGEEVSSCELGEVFITGDSTLGEEGS